jgi:hypothetical protein
VEFYNNSSRKQMASANEYFGPTMYRDEAITKEARAFKRGSKKK